MSYSTIDKEAQPIVSEEPTYYSKKVLAGAVAVAFVIGAAAATSTSVPAVSTSTYLVNDNKECIRREKKSQGLDHCKICHDRESCDECADGWEGERSKPPFASCAAENCDVYEDHSGFTTSCKTCKDGYEKDGNGGCGYAFASKSELQTAVDAWTSDKTAAKAKYGSISTWGVSAVTDMSYLFLDDEDREYRSFNDDISTWDVSSVTTMQSMFGNARAFNQPLNAWVVSRVTNMRFMFTNADDFNQPLDDWDVSHVRTMEAMFDSASSFNQPLNAWVVSSVTTMQGMFFQAYSFNQPLNAWVVSRVTTMEGMFRYAFDFNQNLRWCLSSTVDMDDAFADSRCESTSCGVTDSC